MSILKRKRDENDDGDDHDVQNQSAQDEDTPVLSHAAQRRQRKKLKKNGEPRPSSPAVGNQVQKPHTEEKAPERSEYCVWVGNLNFKTRGEDLERFFSKIGKPTRIHLPTKALYGTQSSNSRFESRGFAYVDFASEAEQKAAIALSEEHLDGRKLLIKNGSDYTGRPVEHGTNAPSNPLTGLTKTARKILASQKHPACTTLFIGNLGFATTEESLTSLLERHMKVAGSEENTPERSTWLRKVRMGTFEDSGKCKGFAFIDFTTTAHATQALTNPRNHSLDGRALVMEYASPDAVRRSGHDRPMEDKTNNNATEKKTPNRAARRPQKSERVAAKLAATGGASSTQTYGTAENGEEHDPKIHKSTNKEEADASKPRPIRPLKSLDKKTRIIDRPVRRSKPGAALAAAPRNTGAIVESQGKKVVF